MPFTFTMPKLSPTMEEGVISRWLKKEGDFVQPGEILLEVATDKATVEHAALDEGWLRKIVVSGGGSAHVGQVIAIFSENQEEDIDSLLPKEEEKKKPEQKKVDRAQQQASVSLAEPLFVPEPPLNDYDLEQLKEGVQERIKISPLARKMAEEKNLDLTSVKGSGPEGRINKEDLARAQQRGKISFGRDELPHDQPGSYEEIPLSPMRKIIGKRLQASKSFIPHFYIKQIVDAEELEHIREELKELGLKLTINDLLIRGVALALRNHPEINSGYNSQSESIIRFKTIDIAVAVAFESGLITPIIRYADYKKLQQIALEVRELAERGKKGKLKDHEYKGGSFTISNLGMYKVSEFTAVINPPQAAILAVGGIEDCARVKDGQIVQGKSLNLVLSCDHRVIDGADGARFLKTLQEILENPIALTL